MIWSNFFVAGAAKSGTTTLYRALRDQVYPAEVSDGQKLLGDASTTALVVPGADAIAADLLPPRIVAILRHPVDAPYSQYSHLCANAEAVVRSTSPFLGGTDDEPLPPVGRYNRAETLAAGRGGRRRFRRTGPEQARPSLDPQLRAAELTAELREKIERLEDLLQRDLTAWR